MGRRKKKTLELKPFCYYCDRSFEDEKVLLLHQKARHFKCRRCNRKLDTATGLVVHLLSVHKETINKVPNALKERESPELVVHGMSGVPPELVAEKQKKLVAELGTKKNARFEHTVFGSGLLDNLGGGAAAFAGMFSGQLFPGALGTGSTALGAGATFNAPATSTLPDLSLLTKILSAGPNTS
ncbi:zinc finger protein, partial [Gregarina niphandrodes]